MRDKEALLVLLAMAAIATLLALWQAGSRGSSARTRPLVLQLSWRAQSESGGFVTASINGYYRDCGLNVELRQGGSGVDSKQLLVGGAVDAAIVPQNVGVMNMDQAGFPARAVFATMQHTPASVIVHADSPFQSIAEMRGHPIEISAASRNGWWPYVRVLYGFTDDQIRAFSGQRTSFIGDKTAITQDVISNGPYVIWDKARLKVRSFKLSDIGYDPYDGLLVVPQSLIDTRSAAVRCLVRGSQRGWVEFMHNPEPTYRAILRMTPEMTPGLLRFGHNVLRDEHMIETAETARMGVGVITDARWHEHAQMLKRIGLLPPGFDDRKAFNSSFLAPPPATAPNS